MTSQSNEHSADPLAIARDRIQGSISWYEQRKARVRRLAKATRVLALALASLGSIFPVISQMTDGKGVLHPTMATVLMSLSGSLVLIDRFWGLSKSWMRYQSSINGLRALQDRALLAAHDNDQDAIAEVIRNYHALIADETSHWAASYSEQLETVGKRPR